MYAGCVACCPLASHVEYSPRALLRLEKDGTDGRTDGRQTATLSFALDAASVVIFHAVQNLLDSQRRGQFGSQSQVYAGINPWNPSLCSLHPNKLTMRTIYYKQTSNVSRGKIQ